MKRFTEVTVTIQLMEREVKIISTETQEGILLSVETVMTV